jgi:hypothetical protein
MGQLFGGKEPDKPNRKVQQPFFLSFRLAFSTVQGDLKAQKARLATEVVLGECPINQDIDEANLGGVS